MKENEELENKEFVYKKKPINDIPILYHVITL